MSTGPLGLTWVPQTPTARPKGEATPASSDAPTETPPTTSTPNGGLVLDWAGSKPMAGSAGNTSALGLEWATSGTSTPPSEAPAASNSLGIEWQSASSRPSGVTPPPAGSSQAPSQGLGIEWRSGTPSNEKATESRSTPPAASNALGLTWVGGSGGSVTPLDPEAQRIAQLKSQLLGPLPAIPEKPQRDDWRQNDLLNRAQLIKSIRADAALQSAFADWEKLPADVKLAAGNRISALEGAIYGFQPASLQLDAFLKKPSYGFYHPVEDKVHLSPDTLSDLREFVNTVTHEQAHAYQWEKGVDAKNGRMAPSDPLYETALSWYGNFFDYAQPKDGYEAYRTQPIEAHAFATGDGVAAGVFSK